MAGEPVAIERTILDSPAPFCVLPRGETRCYWVMARTLDGLKH